MVAGDYVEEAETTQLPTIQQTAVKHLVRVEVVYMYFILRQTPLSGRMGTCISPWRSWTFWVRLA